MNIYRAGLLTVGICLFHHIIPAEGTDDDDEALLAELQEEMVELSRKWTSLTNRINISVERVNDIQQKTVASQAQHETRYAKRIKALQDTLDGARANMSKIEVKHKVRAQKLAKARYFMDNETLRGTAMINEANFNVEKAKHLMRFYNARARIAMKAGRLQSDEPKVGEILKYQDVDFDIGNGYSVATGRYQAPKTGIYKINWQLMLDSYKVFEGAVMHNSTENARMANNDRGNPVSSGKGTANVDTILYANKGDEILTKVLRSDEEMILFRNYKPQNHFLSILLIRDDTEGSWWNEKIYDFGRPN